MEIWIQWLRGPVFCAALVFMVAGLLRLLALTAWEILRVVIRAGDKRFAARPIVSATLRWLLPVERIRNRWMFSVTTLVFHLSTITVVFFLAGHIALWAPILGFSWPALPNYAATALTLTALACAAALVVERALSRGSRALSRAQDYALPLAVALPFASGFLLMHPRLNPFPWEVTLLTHVLSANLLLVLIPLTKLSHMVLLPFTQLVSELTWHFPADAGSRVAAALNKEGEPL